MAGVIGFVIGAFYGAALCAIMAFISIDTKTKKGGDNDGEQ